MKIELTILLVLFSAGFIQGQCCPHLGNIRITPEPSGPTDSIFLITDVTTPNWGEYLGYTLIDQDSMITVEACYFVDSITFPRNYIDTILLGVRNEGIYSLNFTAFQTSHLDSCATYTDFNSTQFSFEVSQTNAISPILNVEVNLQCYPNPFGEYIFISSDQPFSQLQINDIYGNLILELENRNENQMKVSTLSLKPGIYFIIGKTTQHIVFVRKMIKNN